MLLFNMLSTGSIQKGIELFGTSFDVDVPAAMVTSVEEIKIKAERAQPKPTAENPLYANFGKRKEGACRNNLSALAICSAVPVIDCKIYKELLIRLRD